MGITDFLVEHVTRLIAATGHFGVAFLMALESMVAPVPSEAVMPFAGFLIYEGRFTFPGVIASSTLGSIIGSLLSYAMGCYGGRPFVLRFGKYLLMNVHDLELTERFFNRYGTRTIFIARFIPVVRHLISIPAGMGRMHLLPFCLYTIAGAGLWNAFLAWVGWELKSRWEIVHKYSSLVDVVVVILLVAAVAWFIRTHLKAYRKKSA
jgi:membrane protein DedA with SNARE-associated domain